MPEPGAGGPTAQLAEYAAALPYEQIPDEVVDHVKRMTLNVLATTLYGGYTGGGRQVESVLLRLGGPGEATVFGTAHRAPVGYAAAIHAARAFMTMSDDTHTRAQIHSGHATVLPALAVCEALDLSGRDFVTAVVAANEVAIRIAHSVGPEQSATHNTFRGGFWGELKCTFAAAVAAGRAAGLDAEQLERALGIAATSSSGLLSTGYGLPPDRTACGSVIAWEAGKAAHLGMLAADLARAGMTVAPQPLEGAQGWIRTYTHGHGRLESLTEELGTRFLTSEIAIKAHCMSHTSFALVEAAATLASATGVRAQEVESVTLLGPSYLPDFLWRTEITSFEDAVCSTPFAVAMGILEPGALTLPDRVWARVHDAEMVGLLHRFRFEVDDGIPVDAGPLAGAVRIVLRDGRVLQRHAAAECAGSYPSRPLPDGAIERKFRCATDGLLPPEQARRALDLVHDLDHVNIGEVAQALRSTPEADGRTTWTVRS